MAALGMKSALLSTAGRKFRMNSPSVRSARSSTLHIQSLSRQQQLILHQQRPRRMSRPTHFLENGECDPDLALAIQESLKLAQQTANKKDRDMPSTNQTKCKENINNNGVNGSTEHPIKLESKPVHANRYEKDLISKSSLKPQTSHQSSSHCTKLARDPLMKKETDDASEKCSITVNDKLKELLTIQTDLVEHQQELLNRKDREIKALQTERDALQMRLERMERRLSVFKQKESPQRPGDDAFKGAGFTPSQNAKRKCDFDTNNSAIKRFSSQKASSVQNENQSPNIGPSRTIQKCDSSSKKTFSRRRWLKRIDETESNSRSRRQKTDGESDSESDSSVLEEPDTAEQSVLRSDQLYFVSRCMPHSDSESEDSFCFSPIAHSVRDTTQSRLQETPIEVPTWRTKHFPNAYVLEGTENLEDEIFSKRHMKPELEEKRRKRWDMQRLRELRAYQRLKKTDEEPSPSNKKTNDAENVSTFFSRLNRVTHIEVCDQIPVMVFGHQVPSLTSSDFDLPWQHDSRVIKARQNKQTPLRK